MSYEKYFKDNPAFLNDYLNYKDNVLLYIKQNMMLILIWTFMIIHQ